MSSAGGHAESGPVPPTRVEAAPPRPAVWPTVIGIIAIVVGAMGAMANGCGGLVGGVIIVVVADRLRGNALIDPVTVAQMDVLRGHMGLTVTSAVAALALAAVLLAGGIGLAKRRRWSRRVLLVWAVLRIIHGVPAMYLAYALNSAQLNAMEAAARDAGSAIPTGMFAVMRTMGLAGSAVMLMWTWALPVFAIVWLSRAAVKDEVHRWGGSRQ